MAMFDFFDFTFWCYKLLSPEFNPLKCIGYN